MSPTIPRLPLVPDPLRRIDVPRDLGPLTSVGAEEEDEGGGLEREAVERIWRDALSLYRSGVHPTVQLCIRRKGRVVLDRAVGHASGNGPRDGRDAAKVAATPETPFCVYSASKAVAAMVVHLLSERGVLDIDDRVAAHIPEYASGGKESTTIGHVLAHRAGVARLPAEALDLDRLSDREFLVDVICEAKASFEPGRLLAYHAVSGGFILAEIVQRATGMTIREVLEQEILEPLGFRWTNFGVSAEDVEQVGVDYVTGPPLLPPVSTIVGRVLGMPIDRVVELSRDPRFLTGVVPAANVVTTANELSRFFEIFRRGGEMNGVRVVGPDTVRRALIEQSRLEIDLSLGFPTRFSYGLMLGADLVSLYGRDTDRAFGHLGLINIMGWADPERAVSVGLITSGKAIVYPEVWRFFWLLQRITREAPKVPRSELAF